MEVVPIGNYRARDSVAVLKYLLQRAAKGELLGLAVCAQTTDGEEEVLLTDVFRRRPRRASHAATRIFWRSMQVQDDLDMFKNA